MSRKDDDIEPISCAEATSARKIEMKEEKDPKRKKQTETRAEKNVHPKSSEDAFCGFPNIQVIFNEAPKALC